ncbi:nitroreductase family protein [Gordonia sp. HS-NH1]|uniref:nitroreductase family protein n=1 Tax=Gordonia sp. HS-NH1 TaxID=1435068 RepID=UPI0006E2B420|nr:nitroreductase family protein [Gordonia sp. HS-NH1]
MSETDAILAALMNRRSIRYGFEDRPVGRETIERIVACGLAAPSSKNAQPWRFHIVTERMTLDLLADAVADASGVDSYVPHDPRTGEPYPQYRSTVLESAQVLRDVPATIWIENLGAFSAGRRTLLVAQQQAFAGALVGYGLELMGIGAAIENMWIAGNALGLAVSFLGDVVIAESDITAVLGLQNDLVGVIAFGYSSAFPQPPIDVRSFSDSPRVTWHGII